MNTRVIPALAILCLVLAVPAHAGDDGETVAQAKDTIKAIDKARKNKDAGALGAALVRAVELHNGLEGEAARRKLQAAVGAVLKSKKATALHGEALSALEQMDDGEGVFKQLKPVLPSNNDPKVDASGLHAVQIVGSVPSKPGLKYLIGLAFNGKNANARIEAVKSLGKFREQKKTRVDSLRALLELLIKLKPEDGKPVAEAQQKAWSALEGPIVHALDELTFKELKSSGAWVTWHAANKDKLKQAFPD